jgi:hypothetical protein
LVRAKQERNKFASATARLRAGVTSLIQVAISLLGALSVSSTGVLKTGLLQARQVLALAHGASALDLSFSLHFLSDLDFVTSMEVLENLRRRAVLFSTIDLMPRQRNACDHQLDAMMPQQCRNDAATTPKR